MDNDDPRFFINTSFLAYEMQWIGATKQVCTLLSSHIQVMVLAEIYKTATPPKNMETMKRLEIENYDGGQEMYLCFENLCVYREIRHPNNLFVIQHIAFQGSA